MSRYLCYLLVSQCAGHQNKIYVGVTNNLQRRLRQHNGALKRGGAKYTRKYRPWTVVATVRHFATQQEALQFEWALQHPGRTRHLKIHREARLVNSQRSLRNYVRAAAFLVQHPHWAKRSLRLHVHCLPAHLSAQLEAATLDPNAVLMEHLNTATANV